MLKKLKMFLGQNTSSDCCNIEIKEVATIEKDCCNVKIEEVKEEQASCCNTTR